MTKTNLQRKKIFKFKGEEYTIEVPTVGQFLEIENEKILNSEGHWYDLLQSRTISGLRSVQIIECISVLRPLCPSLFNNLKVASYRDIDAIDFIELLKIYQNEISPWYREWFDNFNEVLIDASEIKKESEEEK